MYQTYEDKIVITVNQWLECGLTRNVFEHESKLGRLTIPCRSINGNTLIDVRSIQRLDIRKKIEARFGVLNEEAKMRSQISRIEPDQQAMDFFKAYRYGEDVEKSLPSTVENNVVLRYSNDAAILNTLKTILRKQRAARAANKTFRWGEFWKDCVSFCKEANANGWENELVKLSVKPFERKFGRYFKECLDIDYTLLINQKYGNNNSQKINPEAEPWVIARWAMFFNKVTLAQLFTEYNQKAVENGWKLLKSEQTLRKFLDKPEVKPLWYGSRHGELLFKNKYVPQHRTLLPTCRDAIWYGDGTKLNFYYQEDGKIKTCSVYEVMDAYSECLLGYAVSKTENFEQQYLAYRKAFEFSGQKPYELRFDNQGGHKKLMAGEFLKKLGHLAIATKPYNAASKTIESVFGRFQSQYLHREWFFTGQNITAKKQESRQNTEAIMDNKSNLPSYDEMILLYEKYRNEWNHAKHPKYEGARIELYYGSVNEKAVKISLYERISLFGIMSTKPCTFNASGIEIRIKGVKYVYDVLDCDGFTDMDFRQKNTGRKFFIEYDPSDLSIVNLYEKVGEGKRFVALGQKYIHVHRAKQDQEEFDVKVLATQNKNNEEFRLNMRAKIEDIMEAEGLHPSQHGLKMPKLRGLSKKRRQEVVLEGTPVRTKHALSFEQDPAKELSNMTVLEDKF